MTQPLLELENVFVQRGSLDGAQGAGRRPVASSDGAQRATERPVASSDRAQRATERPVASSDGAQRAAERPVASSDRAQGAAERPVASSDRAQGAAERPVRSSLALNGLNLRICTGEHVAILGPNGSGKSTLIKTITRECYPLLLPDTVLRILGQTDWNIFDLRTHFGVVSNDLMARCTRDISGRELVLSGFFGSIGIWPNHHVTAEMEAAAAAAMARLGVSHLVHRWLDEISSGEARRLLIARALIHHPSTLLLDEPTTSLDLPTLREVRTHLRQLAASGTGLVLVTHHLDDIIPEIERVILLRAGTVDVDGPKEEVLTSERLSSVFRAPLEVWQRDGYYHAW